MKDTLKLAILQLRTELERHETMEKTARMLREAGVRCAVVKTGKKGCSMLSWTYSTWRWPVIRFWSP